jgi:tetratricopeptide (TPR) repeat protein
LREDCYELCENGQQFLSNAQSAEAEREFRKAIDLKLKNPDFQFFVYPETFLIYLFQRTKKIEDGLTFLSNIKKKAPKNFDNISDWSYQWVRFGQDFERTGDVANAERIYQDGIRLYPNDGEIYKRLCLMYERSGHYKDAIKFCEDAIKKGLSDGTKGGFEGRLRRILKRMR